MRTARGIALTRAPAVPFVGNDACDEDAEIERAPEEVRRIAGASATPLSANGDSTLRVLPCQGQIEQYVFVDPVPVVEVVRRHLVEPDRFTGIGVAGKHAGGPLVIARAYLRVPWSRICCAVVDQVQVGVVGQESPDGSTADTPGVRRPGLYSQVRALVAVIERLEPRAYQHILIRPGRNDIHGVVGDDGRGFLPARDTGLKGPGDLQVLHIAGVDLIERAVARIGVVLGHAHPLAIVLFQRTAIRMDSATSPGRLLDRLSFLAALSLKRAEEPRLPSTTSAVAA